MHLDSSTNFCCLCFFPSCMILYAPHCSHESSSLYINTFNIVHYFITQRPVCTLVGNFYLMRLKQTTVAACSGNSSHLKYLEVISKCARASLPLDPLFSEVNQLQSFDPLRKRSIRMLRRFLFSHKTFNNPGSNSAIWMAFGVLVGGEHSLVLLIGILVGIRWWGHGGMTFYLWHTFASDVKSISPI